MRFDFSFGGSRSARRRDDTPERLLLLADLRGEAPEPAEPLASRRIVRLDVDNLDDLLAHHAPSVVVPSDGGDERLQFRTFDDFHPDALVKNQRLFGRLRDLRRRLQDPATFGAAVAELGADTGGRSTTAEAIPSPRGQAEDDASTLHRLLGERPASPPADRTLPLFTSVDALIRRIVAPHVVAAADPQAAQLISAVDVAMSDAMRRVLHDPRFQSVEATWRGLQWLVSSIDLGEEIELHVLHVTRAELSDGAASRSALHDRLVEREARTAGGLRPAALVGIYRFGASGPDLDALESLGTLARALEAPFIAEGAAALLGSPGLAAEADPRAWHALEFETEARWRKLRSGPAASHLGLLLPRVLLRLPYGAKSDRIESFRFEEMPPTPEHDAFLWGNAALAGAVVIARVLQPDGPSAEAGDLGGLPAFVFHEEDEPRVQPCAEVCLSERAVDAILARGLMPLVSIRDTDTVRLIRLQSIADPPTALVG